jgi:phosphatidylglycerophosphatase A
MNPSPADASATPASPGLVFLATGFGLARLTPIAPGTVGAILGVGLTAVLHLAVRPLAPLVASWLLVLAVIVLVVAGIPICAAGQRRFDKKDPGVVVWDELATMPMVFFFLPLASVDLGVLLVGFFLHRLFDIVKPPPCRQLERLPGGLGIMADDVAAALYACGALHVLVYLGLVGT